MSQCKASYPMVESTGDRGVAYCMRDDGHKGPHTDRHGSWPLCEAEIAALREAAGRYVDHMRPYMEDKDCPLCASLVALLGQQPHTEGPEA